MIKGTFPAPLDIKSKILKCFVFSDLSKRHISENGI